MFPRRKRFQRADFGSLRRGRRLHSRHFLVVVPHQAEGDAVVVPKKVTALSTKRHQLKRRVLSVLKELPLPSGLVVFAKDSAAGLSISEIRDELATLFA